MITRRLYEVSESFPRTNAVVCTRNDTPGQDIYISARGCIFGRRRINEIAHSKSYFVGTINGETPAAGNGHGEAVVELAQVLKC